MKRIALVCLLATLVASDCPDDFFDPLDETQFLGLKLMQPTPNVLVYGGTIRLEGRVSGPVVNEVVYTVNGGAELRAISDGGDRFHANVQGLVPGRNVVTVTARGQDVTYENDQEVSRADAERSDTRVIYYASQSGPLVALAAPDTLTIPQVARDRFEVNIEYFVDETRVADTDEKAEAISVSGVPSGLAYTTDCSLGRTCRVELWHEGTPPQLGIYPIEIAVQVGIEVAVAPVTVIIVEQGNCRSFELDNLGLVPNPMNLAVGARYEYGFFVNFKVFFDGHAWLALEGTAVPVSNVLSGVSFDPNPVVKGARFNDASIMRFNVRTDVTPGSQYTFNLRGAYPTLQTPTSRCVMPITAIIHPADTQAPEIVIETPADGAIVAEDSVWVLGTVTDFFDGAVPPTGVDSMVFSLNGGADENRTRDGLAFSTTGPNGEITRRWNAVARNLLPGPNTLRIRAWDRGDNMSEKTITVVHDPGGGGGACADFDLRLDFNPVQAAVGVQDFVAVFVDRAGGFSGQVELELQGTTIPPSEAFSSYGFNPNPVLGGDASSTLSFTVAGGWAPGDRLDFVIHGATPTLEDPTSRCSIPVTFEIVP